MRKMILYRPVGPRELELIAEMRFRGFPPRLPEQPIFYPVLHFEYAEQIARDWNANGPNQAGFITKFEVDDDWIRQFDVQTVGRAGLHEELGSRLRGWRSSIATSSGISLWKRHTMAMASKARLTPRRNLPTAVTAANPALDAGGAESKPGGN